MTGKFPALEVKLHALISKEPMRREVCLCQ